MAHLPFLRSSVTGLASLFWMTMLSIEASGILTTVGLAGAPEVLLCGWRLAHHTAPLNAAKSTAAMTSFVVCMAIAVSGRSKLPPRSLLEESRADQIGRASCRERGEISEVD